MDQSDRTFSTQLMRITLSPNENLDAIVSEYVYIYVCLYVCVHDVVHSLVTNQLNNVLPVMFGGQIMVNNNTKN